MRNWISKLRITCRIFLWTSFDTSFCISLFEVKIRWTRSLTFSCCIIAIIIRISANSFTKSGLIISISIIWTLSLYNTMMSYIITKNMISCRLTFLSACSNGVSSYYNALLICCLVTVSKTHMCCNICISINRTEISALIWICSVISI